MFRFLVGLSVVVLAAIIWINWPTRLPSNVLVTGVNVKVTNTQYKGSPSWTYNYWSLYYNKKTGGHVFVHGHHLDNTCHEADYYCVLAVRGSELESINIAGRKLQVDKWDIPWRIIKDGKTLKLEYEDAN